ncbi:hypothetical protein C9374_011856 [Naegleria lovaniensis]|uniref:RGS domain-containing protein n=1 Tax=Naegleria lovaniensis TaxID=51637 RepID=A0AA88GDV3_NAELO|nr:uncharacterized protein C9374_011856 [Naegleria lovaniensis]KAG2373767.1 hypothetical protein C9374_011856 [Naegleria lovaniensis]
MTSHHNTHPLPSDEERTPSSNAPMNSDSQHSSTSKMVQHHHHEGIITDSLEPPTPPSSPPTTPKKKTTFGATTTLSPTTASSPTPINASSTIVSSSFKQTNISNSSLRQAHEPFNNVVVEVEKSDTEYNISKTGTSHSQSSAIRLKIHTCCGRMIKLNLMKILSLSAMAVNILAFVAIAAVMINAYIIQSDLDADILLLRGDLSSFSEKTKCAVQLTAYGNKTTYLETYYLNVVNVTYGLKQLKTQLLPPHLYILNDTNEPTLEMDNMIIDFVTKGQPAPAIALLESKEYVQKRQLFNNFMSNVLQYSSGVAESKNSYILIAGIVNLTLVVTALVVVVPIVIIVFAMAIRKERKSSKKLKKATGLMLMDTMEDDKEKLKFKEFCQQEGGMEVFTFIDKTLDYEKLCEKQEEILKRHPHVLTQLQQREQIATSVDQSKKKYKTKSKDANSTTSLNTPSFSSEQLQWKEIEKEKYELVFEIFTEYLDGDVGECPLVVSGDIHDTLMNQMDQFDVDRVQTYLKSNLFDQIQKEVSNAYLSVLHFKYKHLMEASKKMGQVQVKVQP